MDEIKYKYDEQFPRSVVNVNDFRNTLRGLAQMDFSPLKPMAKRILDEMEYSSDAAAAAQYAGTGVTITKQAVSGTLVHEGNFSLKAVTDATADRSFRRSFVANLSLFAAIKIWERSSQAADTIQFYLEDSHGNQSRWDITTNATPDTWQQDVIALNNPDDDSGTPADLTDIVYYGFRLLTASKTYYFDTITAVVEMAVAVGGTDLGGYHRHVAFQRQPLQFTGSASPLVTAPISDPRIDILTIDKAGTLAWVQGSENATPVAPWGLVPNDVIPICEIYCKTTMDKVLDYDDKDSDTNQGYILADVRPFITFSSQRGKGADVASAANIALGEGKLFTITGSIGITSIDIKPADTEVFLKFSAALTVTDGSNLKLAGNLTTTASTILHLISDGTNWWEVSRSAN